MAKPQLLMLVDMLPLVEQQLGAHFELHRLYRAEDKDALVAKVGPDIEAICSFNPPFSPAHVPGTMIAQMPKLKIISHMGVGYDSVDAKEAAKRGIIVTNTPDVLNEEVADLALGLLIMTVRELGPAQDWVRSERWAKEEFRLTPLSLRGRKVGIIGLGRIGKAIARRCEAFGLAVSYFGRSAQEDVAYRYYADLVAMAHDVDTLIAILPGGPSTQHIVNRQVLDALGPNGVFINVARGSIVDEEALIEALREGRIAAAGLDVFQNEPWHRKEFLTTPNTVLLPHVGSASIHTRSAMSQLTVDNLMAWRTGKPPLTPVAETPFKGW
jgi:lactate dehydrogenase-like 2-hydroxyacid dehydrogenase